MPTDNSGCRCRRRRQGRWPKSEADNRDASRHRPKRQSAESICQVHLFVLPWTVLFGGRHDEGRRLNDPCKALNGEAPTPVPTKEGWNPDPSPHRHIAVLAPDRDSDTLQRVEENRLVGDRHQLLGVGVGDWSQAGTTATAEHEGLHPAAALSAGVLRAPAAAARAAPDPASFRPWTGSSPPGR